MNKLQPLGCPLIVTAAAAVASPRLAALIFALAPAQSSRLRAARTRVPRHLRRATPSIFPDVYKKIWREPPAHRRRVPVLQLVRRGGAAAAVATALSQVRNRRRRRRQVTWKLDVL